MTQLTTALATIQAGVTSRLKGDSTLMGMIEGVFDEVDPDQDYPYVTVGNDFELRQDTFGRRGRRVTVTLDIWTQSGGGATTTQKGGYKEGIDILARCIALLDRVPLTLATGTNSFFEYDPSGTQKLRDPDDQTLRHIVARFDALVEE